ncbi:GspE/PulE family protein [Elusimicrobiota bacterium]
MKTASIKKKLGQIHMEAGIINKEQLNEALSIQKRNGGKLGTILSDMGLTNEEVMLGCLGKQFGMPYFSLKECVEIKDEVLRLIPESFARHQNIVPISRKGNLLCIAVSDPFNISAIEDIRLLTGLEIKAVISSEYEIKEAINKYYTKKDEKEQLLSDLEQKIRDSQITDEEILKHFLTQIIEEGESIIYVESQLDSARVRCRIDGELREKAKISKELANKITKALKKMAGLIALERRFPQYGRIKIGINNKQYNLTISTLPTISGERVYLKIIDAKPSLRDLNDLGFEPEALSSYKRNLKRMQGLIIVAGPIDSGKTTTIYSTLSMLKYPDIDILTIEDPVEFVFPGITQVQRHSELGTTFSSYSNEFKRQSPDVMMISEIRDPAVAKFAINCAVGGNMVISSVVSNKTAEVLTRLNGMDVDPLLVGSALKMVVTQKLLRVICPECKESYSLESSILKKLGFGAKKNSKISLWRGKGCKNCNYTGYKGRTAIFEVLELNSKIRDLIIHQASETDIMKALKSEKMITFEKAALKKLKEGITSVEEVLRIQ